MKHLKSIVASATALIVSTAASAWTIAEFYYTMSPTAIEAISPGTNPVLIHTGPVTFPSGGKAYFNAVNIANNAVGSTFVPFSPNVWSGAQWTGLDPVDRSSQSQVGLGYSGNLPSYGNNVLQLDGDRVGMFLNTYNLSKPNTALTSALQFQRYFVPSKTVWSGNDTSSQLCVNGYVDLHSWEGSASQAMMTLSFDEVGAGRFFFLNIMMLDTNSGNSMVENVILDNAADTGAPIAHTFFQSQNAQNLLNRYSSPIPGYGAVLEGYTKVSSKGASGSSDPKHYGACIEHSQFARILQDIRTQRPQFSADPSAYKMSVATWGPEIAGQGFVGMSIHASNVFRITP